jgi:putative acetyltransferase
MSIRVSRDQDLEAIVQLFTDSVHLATAAHYDERQRAAWAPITPDLDEWRGRLGSLKTLVSEHEGVLKGFLSYRDDGYIALLYSSPDCLRKGIASALYARAERELLADGVRCFFTEASSFARPFFASRGFYVAEEQNVVRREVEFQRFLMRKDIE